MSKSQSSQADERRARYDARQKERQLPPEVSPRFAQLTLQQIRVKRAELQTEEERVSYWRRLFQGRVEQFAAPSESHPRRGSRSSTHTTAATLRVTPAMEQTVPLLLHPSVGDIVAAYCEDVTDPEGARDHLEGLQAIESALSEHRGRVHEELDALTREFIARLRLNPAAALDALPTTPTQSKLR